MHTRKSRNCLSFGTLFFLIIVSFWVFTLCGCAGHKDKTEHFPETRVVSKPTVEKQNLTDKVEELSKQIYQTMLSQKRRKVAVLQFSTLKGEKSTFGLYLSDKLTNSLFQYADKFDVVDRMHLEQILEELKLSLTGAIEPTTAQQLGKLLGADALVAGTITDLGNEIDVTTRVLGTEQGDVVAVASIQIEKDENINKLLYDILSQENETVLNVKHYKSYKGNLVVNGDFEKALEFGWQKEIDWDPKLVNEAGVNWAEIEEYRGSSILHIYHKGSSMIKVHQTVSVTDVDMEFSARFRLYVYSESPVLFQGGGCWGTVAVRLVIEDGMQRTLGQVIWEMGDRAEHRRRRFYPNDSYQDSPTQKWMLWKDVEGREETSGYQEWKIDIAEFLNKYLVGVSSQQVRAIKIELACWGMGPCARSEIWIDDIDLVQK